MKRVIIRKDAELEVKSNIKNLTIYFDLLSKMYFMEAMTLKDLWF